MNKYYCTGEVLENGYKKCVVPDNKMPDVKKYETYNPEYGRKNFVSKNYHKHLEEYLASLPIAALVVGGKTGWLDGYEERYEVLEPVPYAGELEWVNRGKEEYDKYKDCQEGTVTRIVLVNKLSNVLNNTL